MALPTPEIERLVKEEAAKSFTRLLYGEMVNDLVLLKEDLSEEGIYNGPAVGRINEMLREITE